MIRTVTITRILLGAFMLFTLGCAQNYYNIPRETYEKKVRVLGVVPIFTDAESDIRHPEKETLVNLIKDFNRKNEKELVAQIKGTGSYFSVQLVDGDADQLFNSLFFRRELRDDAGIVYNKYFFKGPELKDLLTKNQVDALFLVVVSGLTKKDNILSSNLMASLETDYNYLAISGQIIDADGNVLWEYPNFRQRRLTYPMFFALQYPDFDEARANATDRVEVKFKTIPGINRALGKSDDSSYRKNGKVSVVYNTIFDDMVSMLKPEFDWFGLAKKEKPARTSAPAPEETPAPAQPAPAMQPPAAQPPASQPVPPQPPPASQTPPPAAPSGPSSPPAEQITSPTLAPPS